MQDIKQYQTSWKDKLPAPCEVFACVMGFTWLSIRKQKKKNILQNKLGNFHWYHANVTTAESGFISEGNDFPCADFGSLDVSSVTNWTTQQRETTRNRKEGQTFSCHVMAILLRFSHHTANRDPFAELIRQPLRIIDCFVYWTCSYPGDFLFFLNLNITEGTCTKVENSSTSRKGNFQRYFFLFSLFR